MHLSRLIILAMLLSAASVLAHSEAPSELPWENSDRYDNTFAKDFIMDAPWRVIDANTPIPLSIVLKDCDDDDIRELHWIRCTDRDTGAQVWRHDFGDEEIGDDASEDNYWAWITTVTENHSWLPGGTLLTPANLGYAAGQDINWFVEIYYKDDWFNYTEERALRIHVGSGGFPWPEDWYGGDVHYHSMYTNNIAEFGMPLPAVAEAAKAMGLHWLVATDHSCDLDETGDGSFSYATHWWEWTTQTPAGITPHYRDVFAHGSSWGGLGADVAELDSPDFRLYRGVEINLASVDSDSYDKTLHCLFYNPDYIHSPNSGAIGERPVGLSVTEGMAALAPEGFAYAAHPVSDLSAEWGGLDWGVNGARWGDQDIAAALGYPAFRGLQAFNTRETLYSSDQFDPWSDFDAGVPADNAYPGELLEGVSLWDDLLVADLAAGFTRKIFLAGGSDAHGDLNFASYISLDNYATDNAMGKVQTVVHVPGEWGPGNLPPMSEILAAYREGRSVATDGPFLEIGVDGDDDGSWYGAADLSIGEDGAMPASAYLPLRFRWKTLAEFGHAVSVKLIAGDAFGSEILLDYNPAQNGAPYEGESSLNLGNLGLDGWHFIRAELLTSDGHAGHRAFTNPIWVFFDSASDVESAAAATGLGNWPNPFNPSTSIRFGLEQAASVELAIFDSTGRRVRELYPGTVLKAGAHEIAWDGRDSAGEDLPSGVYLAKLRAGELEQAHKLLLLK